MPEIRKGRIGDFVRGADTWLHSNQMLLLSLTWVILLGAVIAVSISLVYVWLFSERCLFSNTVVFYWAQLKSLTQPFSFVTVNECLPIEGANRLPVRLIIEESFFKSNAEKLLGILLKSFVVAYFLYIPIGCLIVRRAALRGKEMIKDKYIRGAKLVSLEELTKEISEKHGVSELIIGDLSLPAEFPKKHTLISGTTGAGKSTALIHLLQAIRARGDRVVIYDKKGEFVEMFYRDGVDHLLNPADSRSHQWTPWQEMTSPFDADWISETLLPDSNSQKSGSDKFFNSAARNVLSAALQSLYLDGHNSLITLLRATAWNDAALLRELVVGSPAEAYFNEDNERTLESIRSTLIDGVRPLRLLKEESDRGFFSIREWIAEGDEPSADDSWLFLPVRESEIEIQKPLISTWIQSAAKGLMAQGVSDKRQLWLIIDELPSLQKIPALSMLMAEGRGFGAAVVLGIQETNQLEESFGRNTSKTILGLCSTQFHFRLNNAETAEWVSKVLGEAEREEIDEDLNYSADDIRDGVRVSSKRQNRRIVMPSEIMDLPDLSCFAKIWGVESKARIKVPYMRLPRVAPGFIQGNENETVGMRLLMASRSVNRDAVVDSRLSEQSFAAESEQNRAFYTAGQESPEENQKSDFEDVGHPDGMDDDFLFGLLGGKKQ